MFNAVSKHQKEMESRLKEAPTEAKKSKGRKRNLLVVGIVWTSSQKSIALERSLPQGKMQIFFRGKANLGN